MTGTRRLSPGVRKLVLIVHIIASVGLLGEVWVLVVLNLRATLSSDPILAGSGYRLMETLVFAGGIPLSMLALISGVLLAVTSRWGLVRYYWVFGKLLLLIAVITVGMLLFQPAVMASEVAEGSLTEGRQRWQVAVVATQLAMLISAAILAVTKPRATIGLFRSSATASS